MSWIIEIIGLACYAVLWVTAEPAIRLKHFLFGEYKDVWWWRLISCAMCSGFWIGLLATGNLLSAAVISISAEFICRKLNGGSL